MATTRLRDREILDETKKIGYPLSSRNRESYPRHHELVREVSSKKRKFCPVIWGQDEIRRPDVGSKRTGKTGEELSVGKTLAPLAPQTELSGLLAVSPQHSGMDDGENELVQIEEDEDFYYVARTITSSRWADNNDCEIVTPEKKKSISRLEKKATKKVLTDGSDRAISRSSGSDGGDREDVETSEPTNPRKRSINMLQGCRSVDDFERLNKINEGTYGVVYRARDKKTGEVVALKKVKMEKEKEGFPMTSLREINILLSLNHSSIVDVKEVVVGSSLDSIFLVMEYMEHDLKGVMETMKQPYSQSEVKCLMLQLLEGVSYLHDNWILHRDLKTSNLLLNNGGDLKICDFGLARQYGSPLKPYTPLVVTLWYRAPELLLGVKEYSTAIDMWSVGCILAELLAKEPLFDGRTEKEQLNKIFSILGSPNEEIWPGCRSLPGAKLDFPKQSYNRLREKFPPTCFSGRPMLSEAGFDLLNRLLTYNPEKRITAEEALRHPWFSEVPLPKSKDFMPSFPVHNEKDRTVRPRVTKSSDQIEEQLKAAKGRDPWLIRLG